MYASSLKYKIKDYTFYIATYYNNGLHCKIMLSYRYILIILDLKNINIMKLQMDPQ